MNKVETYKLLCEQIKSLTQGETDEVAKMANIAAVIHQEMGFWWTGFYRVKNGEWRPCKAEWDQSQLYYGYTFKGTGGRFLSRSRQQ